MQSSRGDGVLSGVGTCLAGEGLRGAGEALREALQGGWKGDRWPLDRSWLQHCHTRLTKFYSACLYFPFGFCTLPPVHFFSFYFFVFLSLFCSSLYKSRYSFNTFF